MNKEKYTSYSLKDYLEDQDFRNWVFGSDKESNHLWQSFFNQYPEQKAIANRAKTLLSEMDEYFRPTELKNKEIDQNFIDHLKEKVIENRKTRQIKIRQKRSRQYLSIAASVLLLAGLFSWLWVLNYQQDIQTISTAYSEWKTLTLSDGSKVKLNANSEIKFAKDWESGENREVWLKGEAFFEVTKDVKGAKFTVITPDLNVEVLGTAFNIQSRGEQTEVFLQEGKVRLVMENEEEILKPGNFVEYSSAKNAITEFKEAASENITSWKDGSLILEDMPIGEILEKIQEIFGYEIIVKNKVILDEQRTVSIPIDKNKINLTIPILERVLDTEIEFKNNRLIVK